MAKRPIDPWRDEDTDDRQRDRNRLTEREARAKSRQTHDVVFREIQRLLEAGEAVPSVAHLSRAGGYASQAGGIYNALIALAKRELITWDSSVGAASIALGPRAHSFAHTSALARIIFDSSGRLTVNEADVIAEAIIEAGWAPPTDFQKDNAS